MYVDILETIGWKTKIFTRISLKKYFNLQKISIGYLVHKDKKTKKNLISLTKC